MTPPLEELNMLGELYREFIETMLERNFNCFRSEMEHAMNEYISGEKDLADLERNHYNPNKTNYVSVDYHDDIVNKANSKLIFEKEKVRKLQTSKKDLRRRLSKLQTLNQDLIKQIKNLKENSVLFTMGED